MQYSPGRVYDAVIMNPPYSNKQAQTHTDHAWSLIKPGGRLVTLVGESGAQYIDEEYYGHIGLREEFSSAFSETSVDTFLYLIHVPLY
jgi:16S rRNA G1207 methylase RsmC